MAQAIRTKMMDKDVELDLSENVITKSSIKSALLLTDDAVLSLSYEVNGRHKFCRSRIVPEPCFLLPDDWPTLQFFVESDKAPHTTDNNGRPASPASGGRCGIIPITKIHAEIVAFLPPEEDVDWNE